MDGRMSIDRSSNNRLAKSTPSMKELESLSVPRDLLGRDQLENRESYDEINVAKSQNMTIDQSQSGAGRKRFERKKQDNEDEFEKIHPYELNPFEIGLKNSLFFRVYITGSINTAKFLEGDGIYLKYDFVYGDDWEKEDGRFSGESQYAFRGEGSSSTYFVFNLPFEISLRSINPHGWPQIVISCITLDYYGNESVFGYGTLFCPMKPGGYTKEINIFSPVDSEFQDKINTIISTDKTGKNSNETLNTPKIMASGEGREITRAHHKGSVEVKFQVTLRDVEKLGYHI